MVTAATEHHARVEARLGRVLRSGGGASAREELLEAGISEHDIELLHRIGRIAERHHGVYVDAGSTTTPRRELRAAVLAVDAVVSHTSAASLLGFGLALPPEPHISLKRTGNARLDGVHVHRPKDLHLCRTQLVDGFRVTDPHRTAVDMGSIARTDDWYFDLIARAKGRKIVALPGLWLTLLSHSRQGRAGCGRLRRYLEQPSVTYPSPDVLEARLTRVLVDANAGPVAVERVLTDEGVFVGRVDGLMVDHDIPIEADGWEVHGTPSGLEYDLDRQNKLVLAGRAPLRYTWQAVYYDPARVRREVRRACSLT